MNKLSTSTSGQQHDEIQLSEILAILWGNRWLIGICVAVCYGLAVVQLIITRPVYMANALIQVEEKRSGLAGFGDLAAMLSGNSSASTEIEVLKTRSVLGDVVDTEFLQIVIQPRYFPVIGEFLAWRYRPDEIGQVNTPWFGLNQYSTGGEYIKISGVRISEEFAGAPLLLKAGEAGNYEIFAPGGGLLLSGSVGKTARSADGQTSILVSELLANKGAEFLISVSLRIDAIQRLRDSLEIEETQRKTGVIAVALEGTDKRKIKDVLNAVAKVYQEQNVKRLSQEAERSINFLAVQIPLVRVELEAAEQALNNYRTESSSLDMSLEARMTLQQIVGIEAQLHGLELKESEISSRYKKDHPVYSTLLNQRGKLHLEKDRINHEIAALPDSQQELLRLTRNVEVSNAVYLQLLNKMEELKVIRAGTVGNIRILDFAEVYPHPVKPQRTKSLLVGVLAGIFIGIIIVGIRLIINTGLADPSVVQDKLGLANYGVIPASETQNEIDAGRVSNGRGQSSLLAVVNEIDVALEAIRSVRTSLHFAMMEAKNNIVMIAGPTPGVGKSFVSSNLAALIGSSGQRVLLIDGDMRRGHINKAFRKDRKPGLSNILSEGLDYETVVNRAVLPDVDFISTGSIPPNPSELIMSAAFSALLNKVSRDYDIVLIDTPPAFAVTDAMLIGKLVGTAMLVVRHNTNTLKEVQRTLEEAKQLNVNIKGYIYNCMSEKGAYGDYYNFYYGYRYRYASSED